MLDHISIAILSAVPEEIQDLLKTIKEGKASDILGQTVMLGYLGKIKILIGTLGIGKINAAITTTAILQNFRPPALLHIGCAGAYRRGPLRPGDVLISEPIISGDEGVLTEERILSSDEITTPLPSYHRISLSSSRLMSQFLKSTPPGWYLRRKDGKVESPRDVNLAKIQRSSSLFRLAVGPSLTVGMSSGDESTADKRYIHFKAWAENMEGNAVIISCLRHGIPALECRAISNIAGDRNKKRWNIKEAMKNCHSLIRTWIETL